MGKKEQFKIFIKSHPELIKKVENGESSWQKYYELYDLYGEDNEIWNTTDRALNGLDLSNLVNIVKKIDTNSIQKHINTAQKALGVIKDFSAKDTTNVVNKISKGPKTPRPLNKFFED